MKFNSTEQDIEIAITTVKSTFDDLNAELHTTRDALSKADADNALLRTKLKALEQRYDDLSELLEARQPWYMRLWTWLTQLP